MNHFNRLTPGELERLAILAEECGEIQMAIGKIIRHGYESENPKSTSRNTNRMNLEKEIGDVHWIIEEMKRYGDIHWGRIQTRIDKKPNLVRHYLHHQHNDLGDPW